MEARMVMIPITTKTSTRVEPGTETRCRCSEVPQPIGRAEFISTSSFVTLSWEL